MVCVRPTFKGKEHLDLGGGGSECQKMMYTNFPFQLFSEKRECMRNQKNTLIIISFLLYNNKI